MMKILSLIISLMFVSQASAGLIQWNGSGSSDTGWTMDAVVQINAADVQDNVNLLEKFFFWEVTWSNDLFSHTLSGDSSESLATYAIDGGAFNFTVNNGAVISSFLCAWDCNNRDATRLDFGILTLYDGINDIGIFDADITSDNCCIMTDGVTSFSWNEATSVPAPSLFSLILAVALFITIRSQQRSH